MMPAAAGRTGWRSRSAVAGRAAGQGSDQGSPVAGSCLAHEVVVVGAQPYSHVPDVCGEGGFMRALLWTLLIARFWRFAVVVFGVLAVAWTLDATGGVPLGGLLAASFLWLVWRAHRRGR